MILDKTKLEDLADKLKSLPKRERRTVIALAGAPASGKSTFAQKLATEISNIGRLTVVVPMDGFHLDNRILKRRKTLDIKGAPETFDLRGFHLLLNDLHKEKVVSFPLFDRQLDISITGEGEIPEDCDIVIVEGNYLFLDEPGWNLLKAFWDYSIWLDVPKEELRKRLCHRWIEQGLSKVEAMNKVEKNDMPNVIRTVSKCNGFDLKITNI